MVLDWAARAAPYEKGTETNQDAPIWIRWIIAARAAPYEKGTETFAAAGDRRAMTAAARAAPYEKGTETLESTEHLVDGVCEPRARPPMRRGLKHLR